MEPNRRGVAVSGRVGVFEAAWRGFRSRCPQCGEGWLFERFLKSVAACNCCGLEVQQHRADDLPPYIVIFLVGHFVGWGILICETRLEVPLWAHIAIWPSLTLALCLLLLQPAKGAVIGLQYGLGMHGFAGARPREDFRPEDQPT